MGGGPKNMGKNQDLYCDNDRNAKKCYFSLLQFWPELKGEAHITDEKKWVNVMIFCAKNVVREV